jgi:aerobic carbon-monoxide dehydrogenase medium subunit
VKPPPFDYLAPTSLEEAIEAMARHGDQAKLLAGGQSLVPLLAFRLAGPGVLVDLNRVGELDYLRDEADGRLAIGAMTRHRTVQGLPGLRSRCAMLAEGVELIGHVAIRNRGTVGGSLAHADPAAEWPALALALDGECEVVGPRGSRTVPVDELFVTYFTTTLEPDEILKEVRLRLPAGRVGSTFVELTRRHGDFAIAGVGALLALGDDGSISDARLTLIGVKDQVVRARAAERALIGSKPDDGVLEEAVALVDGAIEPSDDLHGSAGYRRQVAKVLTRRALQEARMRAAQRGGGDDGQA